MQQTAPDTCAARPASSQGVYLYCFGRGPIAGRLEAPGIDGHADVAFLTVDKLTAVFSQVSLDDFSGPSGDANLRDASWIIPRARRHEQVVEEVMRLSPVLPARFGMVLSSALILDGLVARNAATIRDFLDRMADREEWSVKASLDVPRAEGWLQKSQTAIDGPTGLDSVSPGLRYIQRKQFCTHLRQQLNDWGRRTAEEIRRLLAAQAGDVRALRLQPKEPATNGDQMILNCALLVSRDRVAELHDCAGDIDARYADRGVSLKVSGPWPPYSFCPAVLDLEEGS
jgi:hypothetical protein